MPPPERRETKLATAIIELSRVQVRPFNEARFVHTLARHAHNLLDTDGVGVFLIGTDGVPVTVATSDEVARLVRTIRRQLIDGPGNKGFRRRQPVNIADLTTERSYWDAMRSLAHDEGFAGVHTVPLQNHGEVVGSLCLFRRHPGDLSPHDHRISAALAGMATAYLLAIRERDRLENTGRRRRTTP